MAMPGMDGRTIELIESMGENLVDIAADVAEIRADVARLKVAMWLTTWFAAIACMSTVATVKMQLRNLGDRGRHVEEPSRHQQIKEHGLRLEAIVDKLRPRRTDPEIRGERMAQ